MVPRYGKFYNDRMRYELEIPSRAPRPPIVPSETEAHIPVGDDGFSTVLSVRQAWEVGDGALFHVLGWVKSVETERVGCAPMRLILRDTSCFLGAVVGMGARWPACCRLTVLMLAVHSFPFSLSPLTSCCRRQRGISRIYQRLLLCDSEVDEEEIGADTLDDQRMDRVAIAIEGDASRPVAVVGEAALVTSVHGAHIQATPLTNLVPFPSVADGRAAIAAAGGKAAGVGFGGDADGTFRGAFGNRLQTAIAEAGVDEYGSFGGLLSDRAVDRLANGAARRREAAAAAVTTATAEEGAGTAPGAGLGKGIATTTFDEAITAAALVQNVEDGAENEGAGDDAIGLSAGPVLPPVMVLNEPVAVVYTSVPTLIRLCVNYIAANLGLLHTRIQELGQFEKDRIVAVRARQCGGVF